MNKFSQNFLKDFNGYSNKKTSFKTLKKFPFIKEKQCLYVLDWQQSKVTYCNGIFEMLGYKPEEFTRDLLFDSIHPEDKLIVDRIIQGVVSLALITDISKGNTYLNLSFRIKKKDGTYIKVLRHSSPYQTTNLGQLISSWTLLSDISFMRSSDKVEWEVFSNQLDVSIFKNKIYKEFNNFFTKREFEVLCLIKEGFTTNQIASQMFISHHTVISHRKNLFQKTNSHTVKELITFSKNNGII